VELRRSCEFSFDRIIPLVDSAIHYDARADFSDERASDSSWGHIAGMRY